ncbi:hypothetical protein WR25_13048 [Diploscapter pachys]|uniref:G-protein coupled receptors family 1 profile domain-containing protein n=1 Tax=Diploscapter pachys TaxID=2018661 RepID=A0A2A2JUS3_9BILA|nr:hypothetical protein WR25_13048 [Diploscapter pachys]
MCNPPSSLHPVANTFWYFGALVAGVITIFSYCWSFGLIYSRSNRNQDKFQNSNIERKAMKSLSVMLIVFLVTRYIGTIVANLLRFAGFNSAVITLYQDYNVIFAFLCYSQNCYVAYARSSEYRCLLWNQYTVLHNKLFGCCCFLDSDDVPFGGETTKFMSIARRTTITNNTPHAH